MRRAVLVVLLACGHSPHEVGDAASDSPTSGSDASIDASPDALAPGPVSITVYDFSHQIAPGMVVLFMDASDQVVANTTTDANGVASAIMAPGGSVTAQQPNRGGTAFEMTLFTYLDVKPGDQLELWPPAPPPPQQNTVTIKLPSLANTDDYRVQVSCGTGGVAIDPNPVAKVSVTCATADVYVHAVSSNNVTLGYFYVPGVAVPDGATIDFTAKSYTPYAKVPATFDNMPTDVPNVFVSDARRAGDFVMGDDLTIASPHNTAHETATLSLPDIPNADIQVGIFVAYDNTTFDAQTIFDTVPAAASYAFDLAAHPTPRMIAPSGSGTQITWTEIGSGPMDIAEVQLFVRRDATTVWAWTVAGPYTPQSLRLPVLPAPLAKYNLQPGDVAGSGDFAFLARIPGGYDAFRAVVMNESAILLPGVGAISTPQGAVAPFQRTKR